MQRLKRAGIVVDEQLSLLRPGGEKGGWIVHPDLLNEHSVVYSFGVGSNIEWDRAMIDRFGLELHAFDPTPRAAEWIRAQTLPERFHFHDYGIADHDGAATFFPPRSVESFNFSPIDRGRRHDAAHRVELPVKRLTTIMAELGHRRVDVLKIDIEGGEYDVLHDVLQNRVEIGQLLVEFHHNFRTISFERTASTINALKRAGFRILHISPRTYEMSFIRR